MKRLFACFALCACVVLCSFAQKVFTIEGTVAPEITDSCYNVYIGDEYFHIDESKVDMCVPVVDKKFHIEIPCEKVTSGRIRCIFPGGEICSACIDFYVVPDETLKMSVGNGFFHSNPSFSYSRKITRAVLAARKSAQSLITPHSPKFKGVKWTAVTHEENPIFYVKDVTFGKEETVLHIMSDRYLDNHNLHFDKDAYITDEKGNKYEFIRAEIGQVGDNQTPEMRVYGGYYAFKPVAKGTKTINLFPNKILNISNIQEKKGKQNDNFNLKINVSQAIADCGYLVSLYDRKMRFSSEIDEVDVVDKKSSYSMHLDEMRVVCLNAIFPDGSVCKYGVTIPCVPGESAEVTINNGTFYITGESAFYKALGDADSYFDKIAKEPNRAELIQKYFDEHKSEVGCVCYYDLAKALPLEMIVKMLPESVAATDYGVQLLERAAEQEKMRKEIEEHQKKIMEKQKNTQEGKMFIDFSAEYDGKTYRLSDYVGKGKYVLVDFWASWCGPCIGEVPNLKNVWNKYKGDKFEVLGVAVSDKPEASLAAMKEHGIEYPQILNSQTIAVDAYGIMGIPEIILFAPNGTIIKRGIRGPEIERIVKEYLEK